MTRAIFHHPSPSWLFLSALAPRLAPSIRALSLPSSGMVCPNRRTTRGDGPACATWRGNSAARARRCPKKSAAWRRTFAVLATFPGTMLSSGSGKRKRRAVHATALRVSAADAERARAYSATRSSSVSPPAPCFRGGGSVHFGRGSRKSVRPPNAVPLYDSGDIKRLSCEAWGVLKRS